jgi:hypothetical protein
MTRWIAIALLVAVVGPGLGAIAFSGSASNRVAVSDLRPGDCIAAPAAGASASAVRTSCDGAAIRFAASATFDTDPASPYPGDAALSAFAQQACPAALPAADRNLPLYAVHPDATQWSRSPHTVLCGVSA